MIAFWIAAALTLGALVLAGLSIRAALRTPNAPNAMALGGLLIAAVVAIMAPTPPTFFYKGGVTLALLLLLVAEGLSVIPGTPRLLRYGSNTILYFLLWLTLYSTTGRALWSLPGLAALAPLLLAAGLFFLLRAKLGILTITVIAYMANAALAVGAAAALVAVRPALWSALALAGLLLLTVSDLIPAWHRWRSPIKRAPLYATLSTLAAALLLAWSIWGDGLLTLWNG